MGLLRDIFGKKANKYVEGVAYQTVTSYDPVFTSFQGAMYEQELIRASIQRFADACAKLKPEIYGDAAPELRRMAQYMPNVSMTWPTFLSRLATIYEVDATAFVVPSFKRDGVTINGIWPLKCEYAEIVEYNGEPWVRFTFATGENASLELKYVGIIPKFQYWDDYFGEPNCLDQTLQLIHAQAEAQENAIQNGGKIRFIGKLTGQVREEDMKKKRERFIEDNFRSDNMNGLITYDQTWDDIKQIEPQSYTMDAAEMALIHNSVYTYFGTNEDILQNKYNEDVWGAYYEGRVEVFALKLGEALKRMQFTKTQARHGNGITFSSNRLEYATNASKRNMIREMTDRGVISLNEGREILQLRPIEGGDIRIIRGEYKLAESLEAYTDVEAGREEALKDDFNPKDYDSDNTRKDYEGQSGDIE